jgi:hypothetical protein
MNLFRPFRPEHITEQDLLALHLNELSPGRARVVRRVIAQDSTLAARSAAVAAVFDAVRQDVTLNAKASAQATWTLDQTTLDRNWQALRPGLRPLARPFALARPFSLVQRFLLAQGASRWNSWVLVSSAFAAVVVCSAILAHRQLVTEPSRTGSNEPEKTSQAIQSPPLFGTPTLTANSSGQLDNNPFEPGVHASLTSGVYRPKFAGRVPVHPIGLASRSGPDLRTLDAEFLRQPPLTLHPVPPLTAQPSFAGVPMPKLSAALILSAAATAAAQSGPVPTRTETTVSLGAAAQLSATRIQLNPDGTANSQGLNPTAAVVGSVRQSFTPWLGYTATVGYARSTEVNTGELGLNASPYFAIPVDVYETSLSYHLQKHITPRLTGFVDAGGGMLTFLPVHRGADAKNFVPHQNYALVPSVTFRPLVVSSVGIDYHFKHNLALRAEYRGLFYKYPDFGGSVGRELTLSSEPAVSVVYQFGRKH